MKPPSMTRSRSVSFNVTSLIDIVFLLIIFFMVSTKFSELNEAERDIAINVPTVSNARALTAAPKNRVVNVFEDGSVTLDRKQVSLDQLRDELAAAQKQYRKLGVVVRGDADSKYQHVTSVILAIRQADISNLNLSVRESERR